MSEPTTESAPAPAATLAQTAATGESLAATSSAATNVASQEAPVTTPVAATPVAEKPLSQMSPEEHRNAVVAQMEAKKAAKSKPTSAEPAASTETPSAEAVAVATAESEPVKPPEVEPDPAAERLLKLAREGQRLSQERKAFREEQARARAEMEAVKAETAAAQERVARLDAARTSGREIDILRAAGLTDEHIRETFVVNMLEQLRQEEEKGGATPASAAGLTKEQVLELVAAQQKETAAQQTAQQQQAIQATVDRDRNAFFTQLGAEFKSDLYPLVAAVRPTHAELNEHIVSHFQTTGERLTPAQLLGAFEARYKEQGLTVAPKPKPGQKPPAKPVAATSKTINSRAQADAGDTVVPVVDKPKTPSEIRAEGRAKAIAMREAKHAARGTG